MGWLSFLFPAHMAARIEAVDASHAERLAHIHGEAFARPWGPEDFLGYMTDRSVRLDGLFLGRARMPAGFALSRMAADEAEVLSVALARGARGRGHSRTLLTHHLQGLAHAGIAKVHLEVEEGNMPALALYRRMGFFQSGTRPNYYSRPDGTRAGALSMTRIMNGAARSPAAR